MEWPVYREKERVPERNRRVRGNMGQYSKVRVSRTRFRGRKGGYSWTILK